MATSTSTTAPPAPTQSPPICAASTRTNAVTQTPRGCTGRGLRWLAGGSGWPVADQPDGRGDEQHRQREQPAALDPLERPEPAGRLIAGPLRVAVRGEALRECSKRRLARPRRRGRAELVEEVQGRIGEGEPAVLGPPLADDPRGA